MVGHETLNTAQSWLADVALFLWRPFDIGPAARIHYVNFIVFVACGAAVFWLRGREGTGASSPIAYLFPRQMYFSRSSLVDLKVYIANHFFDLQAAGIKLISVSLIASWAAALLEPALGGIGLDGQAFWALALCALLIAMANDFAGYLAHRFSHEHSLLWPFHRVHHSAEVLTPLTLYRKHPFYNLVGSVIQPLIAGPVIGLIATIFDQHGFWTILGFNAVFIIFNFIGANLRHSHIWIGFGPAFSRIFISPAMHQIHHSIDRRHYDRNYGEVFALWDWMLGTLYIPKEREQIVFGVTDVVGGERVQPHPTLKDAYFGPMREFAQLLAGKNGQRSVAGTAVVQDAA